MKIKKQKTERKQKVKVEISAGGIVFKRLKIKDKKEKILLLLIKDSYGKWALPKGHIEEGEKTEKAAIREINEETGLKNLKVVKKLDKIKFFFKLKGKLIFKIVEHFLLETPENSKAVAQKSEIKDLKWVSLVQALKIIEYKNLKPIIKQAQKYMEEVYEK